MSVREALPCCYLSLIGDFDWSWEDRNADQKCNMMVMTDSGISAKSKDPLSNWTIHSPCVFTLAKQNKNMFSFFPHLSLQKTEIYCWIINSGTKPFRIFWCLGSDMGNSNSFLLNLLWESEEKKKSNLKVFTFTRKKIPARLGQRWVWFSQMIIIFKK